MSYGLLVMTHLLTTLMFSPVPIAYVLFLSKRGEHRQALLKAGAGLLLGTGQIGRPGTFASGCIVTGRALCCSTSSTNRDGEPARRRQ